MKRLILKWLVPTVFLLMFPTLAHADYALVFKGKVVEIASERFPVAAGMAWHDISDATPVPQVGWQMVDGVLTAPSPPPEPLTDAELFEARLQSDSALRALVRALAESTGRTEAEAKQWIKDKM